MFGSVLMPASCRESALAKARSSPAILPELFANFQLRKGVLMPNKKPTKGKIIVFGILMWYPLAGVTWQFLHYLIGLRRLGYDPYYVEDSGRWIYDPVLNTETGDASRNVAAVAPLLEA